MQKNKFTLLTLLVLFSGFVYGENENTLSNNLIPLTLNDNMPLLDSKYDYQWDITSGDWRVSSKAVYYRNEEGHLLQRISYAWDPETNNWRNLNINEYIYNSFGKNVEGYTYRWDIPTGAWVVSNKYAYTYDDANQFIIESLEWIGAALTLSSKTEFVNDVDGNNLETTYYSYQGQWTPQSRRIRTFNTSGNMLSLDSYIWNGSISNWKPVSRTELTYDDLENLIETIWLDWSAGLNDWQKESREINTYNNDGDRTEEINSTWKVLADTSFWLNESRYTYSTSLDPYESEDSGFKWDTILLDWTLVSKTLYQYEFGDADETLQRIRSTWNFVESSWTPHQKINYFWTIQGSSGIVENNLLTISLYPNPVRNTLFIKDFDGLKEAKIFSSDGMVLKTLSVNASEGLSNMEINVQNLPAGTYFLQMTEDGKTTLKSFMKQ